MNALIMNKRTAFKSLWHDSNSLHCLNCPVQQKPEKRHESRLKKFWRSPKTTSSDDSNGVESPTHLKGQKLQQLQLSPVYNKPACSLPLLQVWPSQVRKEYIFLEILEYFRNFM